MRTPCRRKPVSSVQQGGPPPSCGTRDHGLPYSCLRSAGVSPAIGVALDAEDFQAKHGILLDPAVCRMTQDVVPGLERNPVGYP